MIVTRGKIFSLAPQAPGLWRKTSLHTETAQIIHTADEAAAVSVERFAPDAREPVSVQ